MNKKAQRRIKIVQESKIPRFTNGFWNLIKSRTMLCTRRIARCWYFDFIKYHEDIIPIDSCSRISYHLNIKFITSSQHYTAIREWICDARFPYRVERCCKWKVFFLRWLPNNRSINTSIPAETTQLCFRSSSIVYYAHHLVITNHLS